MAEDRIGTPSGESQTYWAWTELFRTFQIALDPKKLILAAAGIVMMWIGWLAISGIFFSMRSMPTDANYQPSYYESRGMSPDEARKRATEDLNTALLRYQLLHDLAGPDGLFRTAPWFENRGTESVSIGDRPARTALVRRAFARLAPDRSSARAH